MYEFKKHVLLPRPTLRRDREQIQTKIFVLFDFYDFFKGAYFFIVQGSPNFSMI
jgi:hypothetical protein